MADGRTIRALLPARVWAVPADLMAAAVLTVLVSVAVFTPVVRETPLRVPLGLVFVLFVPGYVIVAALFPERPSRESLEEDEPRWAHVWRSGIDGPERLALSVGTSASVVPMVGLLLTVTPWGVRLVPFVIGLSGLTLALTAVAAVRRWNTPEDRRFRVPYRTWISRAYTEIRQPETRTDAILNGLLVASILLAAGATGYAVAIHQGGDEFSSVTLLTEQEDELVAGDYPTTLETEETGEVVVELENHEYRPVGYTVVAVEQDAVRDGEDVVVREQREIDRFDAQLGHGETWTQALEVDPTLTDEVRFAWLVYLDGEVPAEPSTENAPYYTTLWVTVEDANGELALEGSASG